MSHFTKSSSFAELVKVNEKFDIIIAVGVGEEADTDKLAEMIEKLRFRPEQTHLTSISDYSRLRGHMATIHRDVCALEQRLILGRRKRSFSPEAALNRRKRQIANRGPRPDTLNFSPKCDDSGYCNCKCTLPILNLEGLKGPRGLAGPNGQDGRDGEVGERGPDGLDGSNGRDGDRGEQGEKGPPGDDGVDGLDGPRGYTGPTGPTGEEGERGPRGPKGPSNASGRGEPGERGPDGRAGQAGRDGQDGQDGRRGDRGQRGDRGNPGQRGRDGIDGRDGNPGKAKDGPCGNPGEPGQRGNDGFNGSNGQDGANGVDGPRGASGDAGKPGQRGPPGDKGPQGERGECGQNGTNGPPGPDGKDGDAGDSGVNGFNGNPGEKGPRGRDGTDGEEGPRGLPGIDGLDGADGKPGIAGNKGPRGEDGPNGEDGDDGPNGAVGDHGDEGQKGRKGPRGVQGPPGTVDMSQLYQEIKEIVRQKMYPNGCPATCQRRPEPTTQPTTSPNPPNPLIPLNAVFLVDGSDSIRSGKNKKSDEWIRATDAIKEVVDRLDIRFFSLVQFSNDNIDHIENFDIKREGKEAAKARIDEELQDAQMKDTTNTYHALDHVSEDADADIQNDVLFLITDGEPRDDTDRSYVKDVLTSVRDKFDYVFVAVIGEDRSQSAADYGKIQGKLPTEPIYIDDYQTMANDLVPHFTKTHEDSKQDLMRMKRALKKRSLRPSRRYLKPSRHH